ncbi:MAG: hypothetical protein ABH952_08560 [Candidatus Omnitrophota bacterium]
MEKLKEFLKAKNISYKKLSAMVKEVDETLPLYDRSTYCNWVHGRRGWPYRVAAAIMLITNHEILIKDLMKR